MALNKNFKTSLIAIGCVLVFNHFGAIITGNFSTKSLIISKEELPEPTIMPALKVVSEYVFDCKIISTFFLDNKCFDSLVSFVIPLK